ncbi:Exosome complex component RRP41 [Psilocybe cubensis]|uniref:Ribosomal RNA-processing protein 41 n=2 Tax=Psilocybe cubensis TaxID=181762 RepID=A0A8H8CLY9_PSICU|nr:Exosome complex component RRP41 [Psilocybe cubensis]KAH9481534.1 Exosome complex component RRP41 [Psilocybe cubensis]
MASRVEILNEGGFRSDGRRQFELRSIEMDMSQQGHADGSAVITHGLTQVQVSVFGPREAKMRSQTIHDRANINVEISIAPFSTGDRRKRSRGDKRILEYAAAIKSTFEPAIQTSLYPRSQIDVFIQVIQQDGGLLQACINGTTLALMNAGVPMIDFICAVSGGVHSTHPLLDLTLLEENDVPNVTIAVMPKTQKVSLVTMETRLHVDRFEEVFRLATEAGLVLHEEMKSAVLGRAKELISSLDMGSNANRGGDVDDDGMTGFN